MDINIVRSDDLGMLLISLLGALIFVPLGFMSPPNGPISNPGALSAVSFHFSEFLYGYALVQAFFWGHKGQDLKSAWDFFLLSDRSHSFHPRYLWLREGGCHTP